VSWNEGSVFVTTGNARAIEREALPELAPTEFATALLNGVASGLRVAAFFGIADREPDTVSLILVLADDWRSRLHLARMRVRGDSFESLTPRCSQVHLFEREISEQFGLRAEGHPWFKPVRFHRSYRPAHEAFSRPGNDGPMVGVMDFYRIEGEEVHEVAVGPVHAGVIEPGHFRFQCHGESVFHLEISLG